MYIYDCNKIDTLNERYIMKDYTDPTHLDVISNWRNHIGYKELQA